ncbi:MAG: type II toxin-antitoxin system RelB/DinJ family antitoxin [Alphaproteobacteria bacterium]|nr:type II toxin-antitoxin system RelB/DinJ family antitoxin [Alphaproteobacteria bacterium]
MKPDTIVHARIEEDVKARASEVLAEMGLSVSDAIRILLVRVATERALPFEARVPNAQTIDAIEELDRGGALRFATVRELLADLNADD